MRLGKTMISVASKCGKTHQNPNRGNIFFFNVEKEMHLNKGRRSNCVNIWTSSGHKGLELRLLPFNRVWSECACRENIFFSFFKRFYLFIFRERGREGEREGEKHPYVVASHTPPTGDLAITQACALTGNRTGDPSVCRLSLIP